MDSTHACELAPETIKKFKSNQQFIYFSLASQFLFIYNEFTFIDLKDVDF